GGAVARQAGVGGGGGGGTVAPGARAGPILPDGAGAGRTAVVPAGPGTAAGPGAAGPGPAPGAGGTGRRRCTRNPPPGRGPTWTVPPKSAARSRIPSTP